MKNNKQQQNESKKYVTLAILLTFAVAWVSFIGYLLSSMTLLIC
ncbi:hypothetical protein [Mammaliicoccus sciuri]|nr:hypothetical protein [Mammaliicoccus sciuri]